jgi:hypothetical protein
MKENALANKAPDDELLASLSRGELHNAVKHTAGQLQRVTGHLADVLENHVPEHITGTSSTILSYAMAGVAGAFDGALGTRNKLGPVPINGIIALAIGAGGMALKNPDASEAAQATARAFGIPVIYEAARDTMREHFHPEFHASVRTAEGDAAKAAAAK